MSLSMIVRPAFSWGELPGPALEVEQSRHPCELSVGLFHHALQRMLALAGKIHHLCHLGFGDLVSKNAALAQTVVMYIQHNLGGGFGILLEKFLEDENDKFHRRIVVIEYQYPVEAWAFSLWLDFGYSGSSRATGSNVLSTSGHSDSGGNLFA